VFNVNAWLVRHAEAEPNASWAGSDADRPLSGRGRTQARDLVQRLAGVPLARLLSSPKLRCRQTLEPIALERGLRVEVDATWSEGAPAGLALEQLRALAPSPVVACSHGDLLPDLIELLARSGARLEGGRGMPTASLWQLGSDARGELFARQVAAVARSSAL
jgi:8-oxo-dGTP diphosphatase